MQRISLTEARRLALAGQLLYSEELSGKEGVRRVIEQIGYLQIDTISVIERAHHHILWSRVPDYRHDHLKSLEEKDRAIFEYWAHAASYLPMKDYRFSLPRKAEILKSDSHWYKKDGRKMKYVLDRIRREGPLMSKDFKKPETGKPAPVGMDWGQNPMNLALRHLFMEGRIMVTCRRGFQKVYDLPENVLPGSTDTRFPDQDSYYGYLIDRDIGAHGLMKSREMGYLVKGSGPHIKVLLGKMTAAGKLLEIAVEGRPDDIYYTRPELLEKAASLKFRPELKILSPFDNVVIQRQRVKELFAFDYTLECYVPAGKRKFGYFSLPLLMGLGFAGQIDLKADRKNRVLRVCNLALEKDLKDQDQLLHHLAEALSDFARFNQSGEIEFPAELRRKLGNIFN